MGEFSMSIADMTKGDWLILPQERCSFILGSMQQGQVGKWPCRRAGQALLHKLEEKLSVILPSTSGHLWSSLSFSLPRAVWSPKLMQMHMSRNREWKRGERRALLFWQEQTIMAKTTNVSTCLANFFLSPCIFKLPYSTWISQERGKRRKKQSFGPYLQFICFTGMSSTALNDGWRHPEAAHQQCVNSMVRSQAVTSWG